MVANEVPPSFMSCHVLCRAGVRYKETIHGRYVLSFVASAESGYVQSSASSVGQFCRVESQDEIPGSVHDVDMDFFVQSCFWGYDLVFRGYGRVNPKYKPTKGMTPWIWKVRWGGDTSNIGINRNE